MKKIFLTSAACICMALPSYADIASSANSATCDSGTIGATSGSTGLEANWNANTITIDWYNGNTKITTNTCSYDGAVTIPTTPTRAGYTFNGWRVRSAVPACYTIDNQTTCNANSSNGCAWDNGYDGCYSSLCSSFSNETTCHANPDCAWIDKNSTCYTFTYGTKCNAITTEADCSGEYELREGQQWATPFCSWDGNKCKFSGGNIG